MEILSSLMLGLLLSVTYADTYDWRDDIDTRIDAQWTLSSAFLVFFMQAGFAMLEAGTVASKNVQNILFKNFVDVSIGALSFFVCGFAIAHGNSVGGVFGSSYFVMHELPRTQFAFFFSQYTFASAAATIVSGAMAGRTKIEAYFAYSAATSGLLYPIVVHWCWAQDGWLKQLDFIDFAGSAVVHTTGGVIALIGAWMLGPRHDRFRKTLDGRLGEPRPIASNNAVIQTVGVFILWLGWFGFNAGSTYKVVGPDAGIFLSALIAINTTMSAAAASVVSIVVGKRLLGHHDLGLVLNCALAGLVSITASCSIVTPALAIVIGAIGSVLYIVSSRLILHRAKIDDPLDAFSVHGVCGIWGTIAAGIFGEDTTWRQFGIQLLGVVSIAAFAAVSALAMFWILRRTVGLRVPLAVEIAGIDKYEHGGSAFTQSITWSLDDILRHKSTRRALMLFMKAMISEEHFEFLVDVRAFLERLDIDPAKDMLEEEQANVLEFTTCTQSMWDFVKSIVDNFLPQGSFKEVNIDCNLRKQILLAYDEMCEMGGTLPPSRQSQADLVLAVSEHHPPPSISPLQSVRPYNTTQVAPMPGAMSEPRVPTMRPREESHTVSATRWSGALTKQISRPFLLSMIKAYLEVHQLVFRNYFAKFCQTPAFTKAQAKALKKR